MNSGNLPLGLGLRMKVILSLNYKHLQVPHNCILTKIFLNKYHNVFYRLVNYSLPYIFIPHNVFLTTKYNG